MSKVLTNLEKKLYFPDDIAKGVIYLRISKEEKVEKILFQVLGTEEIRSSKYVNPNSIFAIRYLEANPRYLPNKAGEVLIDEYEFNKFINHEKIIFISNSKKNQEKIENEKLEKKWKSKEKSKSRKNNSLMQNSRKTSNASEYREEEKNYSNGDFEFPFIFQLPKKIPGTFSKMWLRENKTSKIPGKLGEMLSKECRVNYGRCTYKVVVKVELSNKKILRDEHEFLVQQRFRTDREYKTQKFLLKFNPKCFCVKVKPLKFNLFSYKKSYQFGEEIIIKVKSVGDETNIGRIKTVMGVFKREIVINTAAGQQKYFKEILLKEKKQPKLRPNGDISYFCVILNPDIHKFFPSYSGVYVSCNYIFSVILGSKRTLQKDQKTKKSIKILMNQYKPMVISRRFRYDENWRCEQREPLSLLYINKGREHLIPFKTLDDMKIEKKKRIQMDRLVSMFDFGHYFSEIKRRRRNKLSQNLPTLDREEEISEQHKIEFFKGKNEMDYLPRREISEDEMSLYEESVNSELDFVERNLRFETYEIDDQEYKEVLLDEDAFEVNPYLIKLQAKKAAKESLFFQLMSMPKNLKKTLNDVKKGTKKILEISEKKTKDVLKISASFMIRGIKSRSVPGSPRRRGFKFRGKRRRSLPRRLEDRRASDILSLKFKEKKKKGKRFRKKKGIGKKGILSLKQILGGKFHRMKG